MKKTHYMYTGSIVLVLLKISPVYNNSNIKNSAEEL